MISRFLRSGWRRWARTAGMTAAVFGFGVLNAPAVTLYSTEFNNPPFAAGGPWAGNDGWLASDPNNGSTGVTADGGAVYLGSVPPANSSSTAGKFFQYDPVARGTPIIKVTVQLSIVDSDNGQHDVFALGISNSSGNFLGGLVFADANFSVDYDDGVGEVVLPGSFPNASYFRIVWTIDFSTNLASAKVLNPDGSTFLLFSQRPFSATGRALNLGEFDAIWLINSSGTPGNNYLVLNSLGIEALAAPGISIDKGTRHRTRRSSYTLRGTQGPDDNVVVEARLPWKWRWSAVKGPPVRWSFKVKKLKPGRNIVKVRLLDAAGRVIDQKKVTILRK